jgi:hypothetical protein
MKFVIAISLALLAVVANAPVVLRAGAQPHMIFASVNVGRTQTARLNISNIGTPDVRGTASCDVEMGFADGSNQMLLPAVRVAVDGSHSAHVDVNIGNPNLRTAAALRHAPGMQVRAFVGVFPAIDGGCDSIVGSVEIVDNATGATTAVMNPIVYVGFNPQPDIPGFVALPGSGQ